jgi:phospholipid-transporting ATPase
MVVQCEHPNSDIHNFHGTIFWNHKEIAVDATNFILRGSSIRSTSWVVGVVVYTGRESKIMLNSRAAPSKLSTIEKTMNNLIYVIFSAQVLLSTISLVCYLVWNSYHSHDLYYLCFNSASSPNPLYRQSCLEKGDYSATGYFFTYFVLYNNFLPISLYVTVEFCNYVQAYFIDNDLKMYDPISDTPAYARTSNMNGDLGMIEYVFSDKTGTLTENNMIFKRCSVGGVVYYSDSKVSEDVNVESMQEFLTDPESVQSHFVYCLSVAHTVVIDRETGGYQSESPDEETLVKAGENLGWKFIQRLPQGVTIARVTASPDDPGVTKTFEILAIIPFDSTRKRMSVLVRHPDSSQVILYSKGADNIIFERAASYAPGSSRRILDDHLSDFATAGLRTLAIAMRVIPDSLLSEFMEIWKKAEGVVIGRKELVQRAAAIVEKNLTVLGVTAIEDKLQEDVPETIADLGVAGVKLWVLTGDKVQTAINIGYSSRLLGPNMMLIHLHSLSDDALGLKQRITGILLKLKRITEDDELVRHVRKSLQERIVTSITPVPAADHMTSHSGSSHGEDMLPSADSHPPQLPSFESLTSDHLALIVDGDVLTKLLGDVQAERLLLMLGKICKSVLACRVSPEQKRLLVRLVRRGISPQPVTLAIGDGANDVAMIQEAQIGVGISGKEGRQAVNASDFAIAQFRYLKRLMLVHGRSDYRRVSRVILFSLYKNIVLTITLFFFTFFNGFSGQTFFDDFVYSGYNLFLALPVLAIGVFDCDVSSSLLERYNILYVTGRERQDMNLSVFCLHLLHSLVDACIIFFLVYEAFRDGDVVGPRGKDEDLWVFGAIVYNCLFISQCLRCAWSSYTWNWVSVFLWVLSLGFYFGFLFLYEVNPLSPLRSPCPSLCRSSLTSTTTTKSLSTPSTCRCFGSLVLSFLSSRSPLTSCSLRCCPRSPSPHSSLLVGPAGVLPLPAGCLYRV